MRETKFKWANGKDLKDAVDATVLKLLGPKTKEDVDAANNAKKAAKKTKSEEKATGEATEKTSNGPVINELIASGFEAR